jgi:hypothetical protein
MRIAVGICQLIVTIVFRFFFRLGRKVVCHHSGVALPKRSQPVLFVANHVHHLDPPAIFSSLPLPLLFQTAPIKFLSWWRYFWSPLLPIQLLTGCFPTHGPGHSGIDGMVYYATHGYRTFIFPHGKREKKTEAWRTAIPRRSSFFGPRTEHANYPRKNCLGATDLASTAATILANDC